MPKPTLVPMLSVLLVLASAGTQAGTESVEPRSVAQSLDAAAKQATSGGFAGVIAATDADGTLFTTAIGFADREAQRPHRTDERWPWASITKQVTAALVMREIDAGKVALDATLASVLPGFAGPTAGSITLRQLLQHTSGLPNPDDSVPDGQGVPGFYLRQSGIDAAAADALAYCAGPPKSQPGERFDYNNCDYLVLGAVLERVTGRPYEALAAAALARPALAAAPDRVAVGGGDVIDYADATTRAPARNLSTYGAAGALVGTVEDLLAFDRLLLKHALVSPENSSEMWRGNPALGYAALGAWSFPADLRGCNSSTLLVERRGSIGGFQVRNLVAPELGRAVVALANDATVEFGEIWQSQGLAYELASSAFCASMR